MFKNTGRSFILYFLYLSILGLFIFDNVIKFVKQAEGNITYVIIVKILFAAPFAIFFIY